MSFITRCPSCGTAFKVVSDQLKISDGWVRCGQCQHVFDATLDLQPWWPGVELVELQDPVASPPPPLPDMPVPPEPAPVDALADTLPVPENPELSPSDPVEAEPAAAWMEPMYADEMAGYTPPASLAPSSFGPEEPGLAAEEPLGVGSASAGASEFAFVRQAQRKAFWRRPAVRAVLVVVGLLLGALLALQWAWLQRDALVTQMPVLQPVLSAVCRPLGCQVQTGQRLDQFSIDSSALLRRSPDRFAFDMVLKNAASQTLTPPSLELTLTDALDRVVVRRVFAPSEWPQAPLVLPAQADHTVRLELALDGPVDPPVVGYRAILFYP